jgi:ubiquinone/menaquinone biosynthesis C-methylase UbiE
MQMNNRRNRIVYRLWAPIYDAVLERFFRDGRRRAMELVDLRAGERVCIVGVGTGSDLAYLRAGVSCVGLDLSEAMLAQARRKLPVAGCEVELLIGDAQALPFGDAAFDAVILNLIVSVVPDPRLCMAEALRVARPDARVVVFDKFLPEGSEPGIGRRAANRVATLLGTDLNRRLGETIAGLPCEIEHDEPSIIRGMYRVTQLRRT